MITAIVPTLNEEKRIGQIIDFLKSKSQLISQIVIIDDGSSDRTFAIAKSHGVEVYLSSMLGKGASMVDGLEKARNELILFLDGDIYGFASDLVEKMVGPLIKMEADLVKGKFRRQAGRVTALTAKPLLKMLFPDLMEIEQPLGGLIAGRKDFFERIRFENDYGVDIGLLIDLHQIGARIVEADIGHLEHDHQSLEALSIMSDQIVRAILERAAKFGKLNVTHIRNSFERARSSVFQIENLFNKVDPKKDMILIDMDGTLIEGSFIQELTRRTDRKEALKGLWGNHKLDPVKRAEMIAKSLVGIPKSVFEEVARSMPLKPGAKEVVVELKKKGFQVGIITDSYYIAADIIRKRIFADFTIAHMLHFQNEQATGELLLSPLMQIENGCASHSLCKSNFVENMKQLLLSKSPRVVSVGNGENDICLFQKSHHSMAVFPNTRAVAVSAQAEIHSLEEIISSVQSVLKTVS